MNTVRIHLSPLDLTRTRFAFSPLWETVMGYRVMRDPSHFEVHLAWVCEAREATRDLDLSLLEALIRPKGHYMPDFLTPPPNTPLPDFAQELCTLRNTPLETVRREVVLTYPDPVQMPEAARAFLSDTASALERLTDAVERFWTCALEPHWPRLRAMLESDVLLRARNLALGGFEALFRDLNPLVRFGDGVLELDNSLCEGEGEVYPGGRGLLLMPSAFVWPRWNSIIGEGWQPTLAYTPRGVANLWSNQPPPTGQALELLLGRSRAEVLLCLEPPSSTLEIAHRLKLAPGGVSEHLTLLRQAGLVETHRRGRFVIYRLSPTGTALLELLGAPTESTLESTLMLTP